jgi:hypothetical protein
MVQNSLMAPRPTQGLDELFASWHTIKDHLMATRKSIRRLLIVNCFNVKPISIFLVIGPPNHLTLTLDCGIM